MKTYVIGDIHGAKKALLQCLERSGFDKKEDTLICLGDVCDRGPEVSETIETLLGIKHLIYILGNHDYWTREWYLTGEIPEEWFMQGGIKTVESYAGKGVPLSHRELLDNARTYFILDHKLFVHGGILHNSPIEHQDTIVFLWDRSLVREALSRKAKGISTSITGYQSVFVGHTPTINSGSDKPIKACEVWMLDTGAGWGGRLSMMDINKYKLFQSDPVSVLYN